MKIFISYRRDDTAGRAGRLFDVLVARFGPRNVFQDVTAIEPGTDFDKEVVDAIAQSDAALVVIGSDWLTMRGPDGTRRLDEPNDYVRREVGAALASGVRVVPVLVDRAALPAAEELPEELRPLAHRQAVELRDASWHQDVGALVRRLEGEELIDAPRRRWPVVAGAAAVLVVAVLAGWLLLGDDDDSGDDDSSSGAPPACSQPNSSWSSIEVSEGATAPDERDGLSLVYTVQSADYQVQDPKIVIIVLVELANETTAAADSDEDNAGFAYYHFDTLLVDGVALGDPTCFSVVAGEDVLEPGDNARALVGFESTENPAGAQLVLRTDAGAEIPITTAS